MPIPLAVAAGLSLGGGALSGILGAQSASDANRLARSRGKKVLADTTQRQLAAVGEQRKSLLDLIKGTGQRYTSARGEANRLGIGARQRIVDREGANAGAIKADAVSRGLSGTSLPTVAGLSLSERTNRDLLDVDEALAAILSGSYQSQAGLEAQLGSQVAGTYASESDIYGAAGSARFGLFTGGGGGVDLGGSAEIGSLIAQLLGGFGGA